MKEKGAGREGEAPEGLEGEGRAEENGATHIIKAEEINMVKHTYPEAADLHGFSKELPYLYFYF